MKGPYEPSHERALRLLAAGCPLDYVNDLSNASSAFEPRVQVAQLQGDSVSCILDLGNASISYILALQLSTAAMRGVVISRWTFGVPWEQEVDWDLDPSDVVPASDQAAYSELFDSGLSRVLSESYLLKRGRPVRGVLCGTACLSRQSAAEFTEAGDMVEARLMLVTDHGISESTIQLLIDRTPALRRARRRVFPTTPRAPLDLDAPGDANAVRRPARNIWAPDSTYVAAD
jgi:hypothetical protein